MESSRPYYCGIYWIRTRTSSEADATGIDYGDCSCYLLKTKSKLLHLHASMTMAVLSVLMRQKNATYSFCYAPSSAKNFLSPSPPEKD
jgi:hypothetical protein